MSWKEAKRFYLGMVIVSMSIAALFASRGIWMVLPFAGLEMLALGAAMYYVARRSYNCQIVLVSQDKVEIFTVGHTSTPGVTFQRAWTRVELRNPEHAWYPKQLAVGSHGRFVEVGHWLSDAERSVLAEELKTALRSAG
jgi:uncharacterized membrane protein